jgi:hypothetical protein
VQPLDPRDALAAHDVWPDIEDREHDRKVHADRCECRKPSQNSDRKRLFYIYHWKLAGN